MLFTKRHLHQIRQNLAIAERTTSQFYCIPGREWPKYCYDIVTMAEARPATSERGALAKLHKMVYHGRGVASADLAGVEFFRICLDDARILAAIGLDSEKRQCLKDLLLYILAHELIHIVRFTNEMHVFEAPMSVRLKEERRVHKLTWDVLKPLKRPGIYEIHTHYMDAPLEALSII